MIIEQYTDMAGFIRIQWQMQDGNILSLKFKIQPTTEQLEAQEALYIETHQYDAFASLKYELFDNMDLLYEVVTLLKDNPTVTLVQYNNYLATKMWYEQAVINYFLFTVAIGLAQNYGVTLSDYNATTVLQKVRDWLAATENKKIAKVIFN